MNFSDILQYVYTFEFLFDLIYNCCFGLKRRASKFHTTVDILEELTDDELQKGYEVLY